jgi:predicted DNA-binding protein YlxM (UPF0122 family)
MGIYIFESKHGPYIKIGHHIGIDPYKRISSRGFYSCICPQDIKTKVSHEDLILRNWFPRLTNGDERFFHKEMKWKRMCGEWYNSQDYSYFSEYLKKLSEKRLNELESVFNFEKETIIIKFQVPKDKKELLLDLLPKENLLKLLNITRIIETNLLEEKTFKQDISLNNILEKKEETQELFPNNQGKKWNKQEKTILMDYFNNNKSFNEIAKKMGRSSYAIHCQIRTIIISCIEENGVDITKTKFNKEKDERLISVWKDLFDNYNFQELF